MKIKRWLRSWRVMTSLSIQMFYDKKVKKGEQLSQDNWWTILKCSKSFILGNDGFDDAVVVLLYFKHREVLLVKYQKVFNSF